MGASCAMPTTKTTGRRAMLATVHQRSGRPTAARYIKTTRGLALFDENGCFVGVVETPHGVPDFGPAGDTVLVRRVF
jgi:hypothetical protein